MANESAQNFTYAGRKQHSDTRKLVSSTFKVSKIQNVSQLFYIQNKPDKTKSSKTVSKKLLIPNKWMKIESNDTWQLYLSLKLKLLVKL